MSRILTPRDKTHLVFDPGRLALLVAAWVLCFITPVIYRLLQQYSKTRGSNNSINNVYCISFDYDT